MIHKTLVQCPECGAAVWYHDVAVHLYEHHAWSACQIAIWAGDVTLQDAVSDIQTHNAQLFRHTFYEGIEPVEGMRQLIDAMTGEIRALSESK